MYPPPATSRLRRELKAGSCEPTDDEEDRESSYGILTDPPAPFRTAMWRGGLSLRNGDNGTTGSIG
jgi:hypothetical protein